jgi:hypothetical protein
MSTGGADNLKKLPQCSSVFGSQLQAMNTDRKAPNNRKPELAKAAPEPLTEDDLRDYEEQTAYGREMAVVRASMRVKEVTKDCCPRCGLSWRALLEQELTKEHSHP